MGIEERFSELEAAIASLPARDFRRRKSLSVRSVTRIARQVLGDQSQATFGLPIYITEVVLADQGTGTENAWTTISVSADVPDGARSVFVQFEVESTADADIGELFWRSDAVSLPAVVRAVRVGGDEDDAQPRIVYEIPLVNGGFDYLMDKDAGSPNWAIRLQGYRS